MQGSIPGMPLPLPMGRPPPPMPMPMPMPMALPIPIPIPIPPRPILSAPIISAGPTIAKPSTVGQTVAATSAPVLRVPMTNFTPLGIGITQVVSAPPSGWTPITSSGPYPPESRMPLALFVSKIPENLTTEKLKRIFEAFGQLVKFIRPIGFNDIPKSCGVVTFAQGIYALRCLQNLPIVNLIEGEESKIEIRAGTNETNILKMLEEWEKSTGRSVESDIERAFTIIKNILSEPIINEEVTIPIITDQEESVSAALSAASVQLIDDINYDPTTNPIVMREIEGFRNRLTIREKEVEVMKTNRINEVINKMNKDNIERPTSIKNQESSGHFMESLGFTKPREDDRERERDRERDRDRARDRNSENASIKRSNTSDPDVDRENARRRLEVLESLGAAQSAEDSKLKAEVPKKLGLTLNTKKKTTITASGFGTNDDDQDKPKRELITLNYDEILPMNNLDDNNNYNYDQVDNDKKHLLVAAKSKAIAQKLTELQK